MIETATSVSTYSKLRGRLWPRGARPNIWAVFDCARDPQLWWTIDKSSLMRECLYAGSISLQLERAAPYLVQLEFDEPQTKRLLDRGWGRSWGILLRTDTGLKALRHHLRRLLLVASPGGEQFVFRFYDPRVMRAFLPTCTGSQLDEVFGPVECISMEGPDARRIVEFRLDTGRSTLETVRTELSS